MNAVLDESERLTAAQPIKPRLQPLNGAQKRKISQAVCTAVRAEMLASMVGKQLDVLLLPVDRIELRWAVSIGAGLPNAERYDDTPTARPTPLDDATAIVVDQINLKVPIHFRHLLQLWYRTQLPSGEIAGIIGTSRSGIYLEWRAALNHLRNAFAASGHADLIELLK